MTVASRMAGRIDAAFVIVRRSGDEAEPSIGRTRVDVELRLRRRPRRHHLAIKRLQFGLPFTCWMAQFVRDALDSRDNQTTI